MTPYIIYIHNSQASEKYNMWYTYSDESPKEAAKVAWKAFDAQVYAEEPEAWSIVVAEAPATSTLLPLGNFSTGWLHVLCEAFTGADF